MVCFEEQDDIKLRMKTLTCFSGIGSVRREMTTMAMRLRTKRMMVKWRKWTLAMMAGLNSSSPHFGLPYPKSNPILVAPTSIPMISPQKAPCTDKIKLYVV